MTLSGRVTAPSGTTLPSSGITVRLYNADAVWNMTGSATVTSTGRYSFADLAPGRYILQVDTSGAPGLLGEWYNDKTDRYTADAIDLSDGVDRTGVDIALAKPASISGVVTVPSGTSGGAQAVMVNAYDVNGRWMGWADVSADGAYTIASLSAGTYRLKFTGSEASGLIDEWYDGASDASSATALTVAAGEKRTGANATLAAGAVISGRVSVPSGVSLGQFSVSVSVYGPSQMWVRNVFVASDGTYRIGGLAAGDYRLQFDAASSSGLLDEWYDDASSFATAKTITVSAGATRANVDASLRRGGSISGRVTLPSDLTGSAVTVTAYDERYLTLNSVGIEQDGSYTIAGLPAGSIRLRFSPASNSGLQSEWWNDKPDFASADAIPLTAGQKRTGMDVVLVRGASVTGKVSAPAGLALSGGTVAAYTTNEYNAVASTVISGTGDYTLTGLAAGTYRIKFVPPYGSTLLPEWFDDAASYASAAPVTLTAAENRPGVDATLVAGGVITGTVTVPPGSSLVSGGTNSVMVRATSDIPGTWMSLTAAVNSDGTYTIPGVPAGDYRVQFDASAASGLVDEYFDDTSVYSEAAVVSVKTGRTTTGIDAALAAGGSVSGRVTLPSGMTIDSMEYRVTAYGANQTYAGSTQVNADGTYTMRGLVPGSYRLQFSAPLSSGVLSEWYKDKAQYWAADSVTVSSTTALTGVDVTLERGARVTGSVLDSTGAPVANARVTLYSRADGSTQWRSTVQTDSAGAYAITGLGAGTYIVEFVPSAESGLRPVWWRNSPNAAGATALTLAAGQTRTGVSATLSAGAIVRGKVTGADGSPVTDAEVKVTARSGAELGFTRTDGAGAYVVSGVESGDIAVGVVSSAGLTYANGATSLVAAPFQTVVRGRTTTVDIALTGRSVSGVVSGGDNGAPLTGGTVTLYSSTGAAGGKATISRTGTYVLRNVPAGTYALQVQPADTGYAVTWSDGAGSAAEADYFRVGTTSIKKNVTVSKSASITGFARSEIQSNMSVALWRYDGAAWSQLDSRWVNAGGPFSFTSLSPGVYAVMAHDYSGFTAPSDASRVTLTAGASVDVGTVTDAPNGAGAISGRITGSGRATGTVTATDAKGKTFSTSIRRQTDGSLRYSFAALPAGSYTLLVTTSGAPSTWYGGTTPATATRVAVSSGSASVANIAVAAGTSSLVGRVTDAAGEPVPGANVTLLEKTSADRAPFERYVSADGDGRYSFSSLLAPGRTYVVSAYAPTSRWSSTAEVLARRGSQTVDLTLRAASTLRGTVVDARSGAAVAGTPVRAVADANGEDESLAVTDAKGRYDFSYLRGGSYRIQVGSFSSGYSLAASGGSAYAPEWVADALTKSAATAITVKPGASATVPTAKLAAGGVLSGRVKATLATGGSVWLQDATVSVRTLDGEEVATASPQRDGAPGSYALTLPPGSYRICATTTSARLPETCRGSTFSVTAGAVTAAADVTIVELRDLATAQPTIRGTAAVGSVLTAVPGTWTEGATLSYRWYAGASAIAGATKKTYTPTSAQAGKTITVRVTGAKEGYLTATRTSRPTAAVR